jgi:hypothetical protein
MTKLESKGIRKAARLKKEGNNEPKAKIKQGREKGNTFEKSIKVQETSGRQLARKTKLVKKKSITKKDKKSPINEFVARTMKGHTPTSCPDYAAHEGAPTSGPTHLNQKMALARYSQKSSAHAPCWGGRLAEGVSARHVCP